METLSTILEFFGKPLSLITLCSSTFAIFVFIENMSAAHARADFALYIKSTDFAKAAVRLPSDTRALFQRVFGTRHISWRCLKASILFSVAAFASVVILNLLNDPKRLPLALAVWEVYPGLWYSLLAYAIWSIVPDYINLLKTRKVLDLITTHQIDRPSLLAVILFVDFILGYAIFIISCWPMGLLSLHFWLFLLGELDWNHLVSNFGFSPLPILAGFKWPFEMFFWSGMVPSIWLWFYVAATLIVRLAVVSAPVLRFSIYFFDIDQHPIRSVGVVAAALAGCLYVVLLVIGKFAGLLAQAA